MSHVLFKRSDQAWLLTPKFDIGLFFILTCDMGFIDMARK